MFGLPRTVVILALVSFLNDAASEMITPLLPLFLTATLGAGPAVAGLAKGVAEATVSLLKLVSDHLADRGWNHRRLVTAGTVGGGNDTFPCAVFLAYAGALAATEGAEWALVGDFTPGSQRNTAFGLYHMTVGLAALPGALLVGGMWQFWGAQSAFGLAAVFAGISMLGRLWGARARPPA